MKKLLNRIWLIISTPFRLVWYLVSGLVKLIFGLFAYFQDFFTYEPQDSDILEIAEKVGRDPSVLFPQINALRRHIFRAVLFLTVTTAFSFLYAQKILEMLSKPLLGGANALNVIDVTEPIGVFMRVSLLTGFTLALPYILLEILLFIGEGLRRKTRLFLVLFVLPFSTILFICGMAFAYFIMLPVAVPFLLNVLQFQTTVRASSYINFVTNVMFWLGTVFEFPMVIFVMARLGWIRAKALAHQWRLAMVLIAVLAALITPTVDPVNMAIVMGPMMLLYFLSIGLAYIAQPKQNVSS